MPNKVCVVGEIQIKITSNLLVMKFPLFEICDNVSKAKKKKQKQS